MLDEDVSKVASKGNESFQDIQANLSNITFYPTIERSIVTYNLTRFIVEHSDAIEGNITLNVKEAKESETMVEIENIFDEVIVEDFKDAPLLEKSSIKVIIVDNRSNDNVSFTNIDEYGHKDLRQDINNNLQIVREEINTATFDDLKSPTI